MSARFAFCPLFLALAQENVLISYLQQKKHHLSVKKDLKPSGHDTPAPARCSDDFTASEVRSPNLTLIQQHTCSRSTDFPGAFPPAVTGSTFCLNLKTQCCLHNSCGNHNAVKSQSKSAENNFIPLFETSSVRKRGDISLRRNHRTRYYAVLSVSKEAWLLAR